MRCVRLALPFAHAACMHNAPSPTHVRILNDLPVDCTSVSLTASVCVVAQKRPRLRTDETACLGQTIPSPFPFDQMASSAGESRDFSRACRSRYPSPEQHISASASASRCGRVELCPAESQSFFFPLVSQRDSFAARIWLAARRFV